MTRPQSLRRNISSSLKPKPSKQPAIDSDRNWLSEELDRISRLDRYVKPEKVNNAIKLDSNENFVLDKEFISKVITRAVERIDLREYPLKQFDDLSAQLAKYSKVDEKYIAIGNGSDQIIELILSVIGKERRATVFTPTFSYFLNRCNLHGIKTEQVPLNMNFTLNKTAFLKSARKSDIIYICSPNNPTGTQFDKQVVVEITESLEDKLILIDEAYVDFADYSMADFATKHKRNSIVVLRTMSKAFGLAGARVGYAITNEKFASVFRSVIQSPYPVSSLSLEIATNALMLSEQVMETINQIRAERQRMIKRLEKIKSVKTFRSDANFLFIDTGNRYSQISNALRKNRIIVKMLGAVAGYSGCMRVTIGTREMNEKFLQCIEGAV